MAEPFELLEHTADMRIKATGAALPELFVNMMRGLFAAMKPQTTQIDADSNANKRRKRQIAVESSDKEALLVDFLNTALYLGDIHQEVYDAADFTEFADSRLSGTVRGKKREAVGLQVKAATHHDLNIIERNGAYEATVVFDI